jgi:protein phosphatase
MVPRWAPDASPDRKPGAVPRLLTVPDPALVVLVGVAGSGKTTFARRVFAPTQVLSTDAFRAMVTDDEADQSAGRAAFELLHRVAALRLARGRLTVVDATNTWPDARADLVDLAHAHGVPAVAIVLGVLPRVLAARNRSRADRPPVPEPALRQQRARLRAALGTLAEDGFAAVHVLAGPQEVDSAAVELVRAARGTPPTRPL